MDYVQQSFSVKFEYKVYFTNALFALTNPLFNQFIEEGNADGIRRKILFVADEHVATAHPGLLKQISAYFKKYPAVELAGQVVVIPGGEIAKNTTAYLEQVIDAVNDFGIDRHSYIAAIGGGSVLDMAGYAAAISHRGIKHIRIPTTVLSQNDSGVGVKNGINSRGKKNFLGTFAPPVAVFNDEAFLLTLTDRDWRSGISEAVKVALIKDRAFFEWLEANAVLLANRDMTAMANLIKRCVALHMEHISGGDPFEFGSSRPLDFDHWSAHKLEQLSNFEVTHGEAVAMGIALDSAYSSLSGRLPIADFNRILGLFHTLQLPVRHPLMEVTNERAAVIEGLEEFREHLGGQLTIMLLQGIGTGEEVHAIDNKLLVNASRFLQEHDGEAAGSSSGLFLQDAR